MLRKHNTSRIERHAPATGNVVALPRQAPKDDDTWPALRPIESTPLQEMPRHVFPLWFENHAEHVAKTASAPYEFPFAAGWAVLSAVVGNRVRIARPSGYSTQINAYLAVVADPSASKSGCVKPMKKPLEDLELERRARDGQAVSERCDERDLLEARIQGLKDRAKKNKPTAEEREELRQARQELDAIDPSSLVVPSILEDDATPEALSTAMMESGGSIAVIADEGSIFAHVEGAYSKQPNIALLLKAYDGGTHKVRRASGRRETIKAPCMTLCVFVQPSVIHSLVSTPAGARGLLARPRFLAPDCRIGYRDREQPQAVPELAAEYARGVKRLGGRWLDAEPVTLTLSAEAEERFSAWWTTAETERRPGGRLHGSPRFMEWGGKDGEVLRLAGLLHVAHEHDERTPVALEQIDRAIAVWDVLVEHARRMLDAATTSGLTDAQKKARAFATYLRSPTRDSPEIFTLRDVRRVCHCASNEEAEAVVDFLDTNGWCRPLETKRRDSRRFEVNPSVMEGA